MIRQALQSTPLNIGNVVAWVILSASLGFAAGWVANGERMYDFCMVP